MIQSFNFRSMMEFDAEIEFDPGGDLGAMLAKVPAKWVVYLMKDADGHPVQLLCVKNLRASLERRLGENEEVGPSRRVGYRELVRRIAWRRVDSAFEADLVYLEMARQIFPETYRGMLAFKEVWFLAVDPEAAFPRYVKTNDPARAEGVLIGPIEDKHAAGRLIELIEDTFDLCRYFNVLLEAPRGKACAYKEMGRCAAPCDGSESMENYRGIVRQSLEAMLEPGKYRKECEEAMRAAAGELNFELAGKIKIHLERGARLHAGAFSHLRALSDFRFLGMQRGPGERKGKLFLITPGRCEEMLGIISSEVNWRRVVEYARVRMEELDGEFDRAAAERMAVAASHLFMPKKQGVLLGWENVDEKTLAAAYRQLAKQKVEEDSVDEGVVRDLQGI